MHIYSHQLNKSQQKKSVPPMMKIKTSRPFELLAIDLVSLQKSQSGKIGCLVAVDHFSKWMMAVPLTNKKANTVAKCFETHILPTLPQSTNILP